MGNRPGTPWTSRQSNAGHHRDTQDKQPSTPKDETTKGATSTFPSHRKYSWISASLFSLCLCSVLSNPQSVVADGRSH
ncbi:hypothetical protein ATANTOWER_020908 [Ataeniobius toweri]|uniref:Uncharacterized protein n=1 Tax=Ataeniobius toweri TaxID=208326 RepID=A0ABU7ARC8_9TELE|nr:hypothetical protein [Ataeniobius toweri]